MKRKESELTSEHNSSIVERIRSLKAEHPFWGYRRIWTNLKYVYGLDINKKRVFRLMQKHYFLVKSHTRLKALDMGLDRQFPDGVRDKQLFLMSDNGSQPTSVGFMKTCRELHIHQAFTRYNNPKGNADTERIFRTMKEELFWLREWPSPFELSDALGQWIVYYKEEYLHSTLGYKSPIKYEEEYRNSQITHLVTS